MRQRQEGPDSFDVARRKIDKIPYTYMDAKGNRFEISSIWSQGKNVWAEYNLKQATKVPTSRAGIRGKTTTKSNSRKKK